MGIHRVPQAAPLGGSSTPGAWCGLADTQRVHGLRAADLGPLPSVLEGIGPIGRTLSLALFYQSIVRSRPLSIMLYDTKFNFVGQYFFSDLCISSLDYCNIGLPYNIIWSYPLAFFSSQYSVLVSLLLLFIEVIWNFIFPVYFSFFHIILIVLCGHSDLVVQSVSFCHSLLSTSTAVCLVLNQTSSALSSAPCTTSC